MESLIKPKIAYIIGSLEMGGAERHLTLLMPAMQSLNYQVSLITLGEPGILADSMIKKGIQITSLRQSTAAAANNGPLKRLKNLVFSSFKIANEIRKNRYDLIHFFLPHAYVAGMLGWFLSGCRGIPILSRRSLNNYQKDIPGMKWIERGLHRYIDVILCNSNAIRHQMIQEEGVQERQISTIYNNVDSELFRFSPTHRENYRKKFELQPQSIAMIQVANLIPYKGHADVIQGLHEIKKMRAQDLENLVVFFMGRNDGIRDGLQKDIEIFGLQKNVRWLEPHLPVHELLSAFDIGLLASHQEGFPNVILEYMATGLPVIATTVGGSPEAVEDGQSGILIAPRNPLAIAKAVCQLVQNPSLRTSMGQRGLTRAKSQFTTKVVIEKYDQVYKRLLNERR